jgi:hypothetical protein
MYGLAISQNLPDVGMQVVGWRFFWRSEPEGQKNTASKTRIYNVKDIPELKNPISH